MVSERARAFATRWLEALCAGSILGDRDRWDRECQGWLRGKVEDYRARCGSRQEPACNHTSSTRLEVCCDSSSDFLCGSETGMVTLWLNSHSTPTPVASS